MTPTKRKAPRSSKGSRRPAAKTSTAELTNRIAELEETLEAVRSGAVDAFVVTAGGQEQLFTLQGAETPYRMFVEHMREGALTVDPGGTILYANQRFAEITGTPLQRIIGSAFKSYFARNHQASIDELLASSPRARELTVVSAEAEECPAYVSVSQRVANQGLCVLVTDLTEKKAAERIAASERKHRFMTLLNRTVVGALADGSTLGEALVQVVGQYFGVTRCLLARVDADGLHWMIEAEYVADIVPLRGRHTLAALGPPAFDAALREGRSISVTDVSTDARVSGSRSSLASLGVRTLLYVPQAIDDAPVFMMALCDDMPRSWTVEDVTLAEQAAERVWAALDSAKADDVIRQRESRYRSLVEATTSIVWTTNHAGEFVEPQPSWQAYTGQSFDEYQRVGWLDAIHPDDRGSIEEAWANARRQTRVYEVRGRLFHAASNSYRHFAAKGVPVGQRGPVVEWVGTCADIEESVVAEHARQELLVSERAARTEAERASYLKDQFLATLSHELRTPLNAILGWSTLVVNGLARGEDVSRGLQTIQRNAKAQTKMIEDLLDMSRITSGKLRLEVQRVDLVAIIEAAIESIQPAADAKGIRLQSLLDRNAAVVNGDPSRLQQVVWNLLTNAIKFTPKAGRVQVLLERAQSQAVIRVTDNGVGINAEFLPFVFDHFRQADASTTRRQGGLGLGLAIIKSLVESHGGSVMAKSAGEGTGATFVVALPLSLARNDAPLPEPMVRTPSDGKGVGTEPESLPMLDGVRVVYVDDELDARELVTYILGEYGAKVWTAASCREGLHLVRTIRPDVLVSDIGMPDEDGYDLIRAVRGLPDDQGGGTVAAAVTALARSDDRRRALLAGFQTHVAKPVEPSELVAVVASLTRRTGRGAQRREP